MKVSTIFAHNIVEVILVLKEKRLKKGLTLLNLAEKVGISEGYMSKLEKSKISNTTIQIILKISQELDICPVEVFLFLSGLDCKFKNKFCKKFKCHKNIIIKDCNE